MNNVLKNIMEEQIWNMERWDVYSLLVFLSFFFFQNDVGTWKYETERHKKSWRLVRYYNQLPWWTYAGEEMGIPM